MEEESKVVTNGEDLTSKFNELQERIKELETQKAEKVETQATISDDKESNIEKSRIHDLENELEALKHNLEVSKDNIILEAQKRVELNSKLSNVISDKKELLEASLKGKSIDEQLEFIDKHSTMFLFPESGYKGNSGAGDVKTNADSELDNIMSTDLIKESGLSRDEVNKFLKEDEVLIFERKLLNDLRGIRSSNDVFNFFNKGGK